MKQRLYTFIIMLTAMLCASMAVPVLAQEQGTAENPILISDAAGLAGIKDGLTKHYKLTANIDLGNNAWTPLGAFTGTLDGDGHVISGLNVSVDGNAGLFEAIGTSENTNGTVKNLGVTGSVTSNCTSQYAGNSAGGIAGKNYGIIQNCYTSVTVTCNLTNDMCNAGGIAGMNGYKILNCYTTGAVTCEKGNAGGIAGESSSSTGGNVIQYCYATGAINGNQAGGITGYNWDATVQNCIALNSSITGTGTDPKVGRIAGVHGGYVNAQKLADNYAAPSIPGTWADKGADKKNGADLTKDNFTGAGAFAGWTATNWDFTTASANLPQVNTDGGSLIIGQPTAKPRADYLVAPVTTITTQKGLADIKDNFSGSYKLGDNITLSGDWTPLGEFTGTLDGCGYTISGLKVSVTGSNAGLFAKIGAGGTVKNLGVTGTSVTGNNDTGGIAGSNSGTIQNCYTNVAVTSTTANYGAGGIAGYNLGTILNCYTTGKVTNERGYAGGIAGSSANANGGVKIQYCYATGVVKGNQAGGITGNTSIGGSILNCIALNDSIIGTNTSGNSGVGRITGYRENDVTTLTANHAALSIPGVWTAAADKGADKKNGADLPSTFGSDGAGTNAFTGWIADNWDFTTTANLPILLGFKTADQPVKERAPFLEVPVTTITDQAGLAAIKSYLAGSYKLGDNIALSGDWTPLGEFTGTLDGNGYVISGLNVSVTDSEAGLFETIGVGGTVKNLGVTGGSVTAPYSSAGSIAGENSGTIQNCYTNVTVTASNNNNAGGITGKNSGTIQNCYTTGVVTSKDGRAGGIAGVNASDKTNTATIQYCYATGVIKGYQAGGISGNMSDKGLIQNCFALNDSIKGNTAGSSLVGRILGYKADGTLANNYAALSIPGVWEAYYKGADKENGADLLSSFGSDKAGEGVFAGWKATDWNIETANLPILLGFKTADQPVKDKKRAPFLEVPVTTITDQAGLAAIKDNLAGSYKLGDNITLTGNWTPLGNEAKGFTGTLDGCGFTISGLNVSMTATTSTYAGLFGYIDKDGTVKNLGVTGSITVTTTGDYAYAYVGGIAGYSAGKIMNCYTDVTVSATSSSFIYAGGIVGYLANANLAISNCFTTGDCTANGTGTSSAIAGGILGGNNGKGAISYCFATGTIEAKGATSSNYAGGIAGQNGIVITGCIALNKGGITGASGKTNRIAGKLYEGSNGGSYADCYASPAIPGTWSNIGATNLDGADLTNANFINSNDAFTGWVPSSWLLGDNWQFEANDFTNLPTLLTTVPDEDIALKGQPTIKRADCFGLVLIDKAVTYDATLHKDKNLVIAPTGNLTVNTAGAQVSSLEIQPGGQVTTTTALGVTKAISTTRTLTNKWMPFGAPIKMTLSLTSTAYMLNGYSAAASQEWMTPLSSASSLSCEASSPYLLASDVASSEASFSSGKGITIPVSAKPESGSALSNGIFLFRTNPSFSNQAVTNVYILSDDGTRFERQATYTLKPFECYMTANAATTKAVQSLRVDGGAPTGNEPAVLPSDAFRLWGADGQLHLEASQPTDVQVYTLTGTLTHSFRLDGSRTLTLGHGIYLVRSNNITYKVSL